MDDNDSDSAKVTIKSLTFTSDHGVLRDGSTTFRAPGNVYSEPEFLLDSRGRAVRQFPITQTKGTTIKVKMVLKCSKPGFLYKVTGAATLPGLNFTYTSPTSRASTGGDDTINLIAASPLPTYVDDIVDYVQWTVSVRTNTAESVFHEGPTVRTRHRIFCLFSTPIETCSTLPTLHNYISVKRVSALLSSACASRQTFTQEIAKKVQTWRDNNARSGTGNQVSGVFSVLYTPDDLWALLDSTSVGGTTGQCAAGAELMEVAMRILGCPATYFHILPAQAPYTASKAVFNPIINPTAAPPKRTSCPFAVAGHGAEEVWLDFGTAGNFSGLNDGDGCVRIKDSIGRDEYFATWAGGIVGIAGDTASGWRSFAVHGGQSVLRQLSGGTNDFQLWSYSGTSPAGPMVTVCHNPYVIHGLCVDNVPVP